MEFQGLKDKLDELKYPHKYMYKFIIKTENIDDVYSIISQKEIILKPSSKGKYSSITFEIDANSSDEIIAIYERFSNIEGIISL